MKRNPTNKYGAVRSEGYDSQAERQYADVLELLRRAGQIKDYQHHPPAVELMPSIKWKVDYKVTNADGREFYIEVKGFVTEGYSLKLRIWKDQARAGERDTPLFIVTKYGDMRFKVVDSVNAGTIEKPVR